MDGTFYKQKIKNMVGTVCNNTIWLALFAIIQYGWHCLQTKNIIGTFCNHKITPIDGKTLEIT